MDSGVHKGAHYARIPKNRCRRNDGFHQEMKGGTYNIIFTWKMILAYASYPAYFYKTDVYKINGNEFPETLL